MKEKFRSQKRRRKGENMKNNFVLFSGIAIILVLLIPPANWAQHGSGQEKAGMSGKKMDMGQMMESPQHKLMMAYMKTMSTFATTLRDHAMKPNAMDVEVARATVGELRHNLNAMEALHHKHMQSMSAEMRSKMKMMMEKMDKERTMLKEQVSALETDVQADKPESAQVTAHANALLKHLEKMLKMHSESDSKKKTE